LVAPPGRNFVTEKYFYIYPLATEASKIIAALSEGILVVGRRMSCVA